MDRQIFNLLISFISFYMYVYRSYNET